jgi:glutamate-ammonia-ligase adenylyltransferase
LVDIEFMVHFLQLRDHIARTPELGEAVEMLERQGLFPPGIRAAHDLMARLLVVVRLVAPDGMFPPEASRAIVARACGLESWDALLDAVLAARRQVATAWTQVFEIALEIEA